MFEVISCLQVMHFQSGIKSWEILNNYDTLWIVIYVWWRWSSFCAVWVQLCLNYFSTETCECIVFDLFLQLLCCCLSTDGYQHTWGDSQAGPTVGDLRAREGASLEATVKTCLICIDCCHMSSAKLVRLYYIHIAVCNRTSVLVLFMIRLKYTLVASHAAPWWVTVSIPTRQTDPSHYIMLSTRRASVLMQRVASLICLLHGTEIENEEIRTKNESKWHGKSENFPVSVKAIG